MVPLYLTHSSVDNCSIPSSLQNTGLKCISLNMVAMAMNQQM